MPESLSLVLLVALGVLLVLGLGVALLLTVERRSASTMPMTVAYRAAGQRPWRRGTLRFVAGRLVLRGPGGLAGGPWQRGNLDLGVTRVVDPEAAQVLGRAELVQVPVSYGGASFELALGADNYTALRAWVEAAPPGWNSHVA